MKQNSGAKILRALGFGALAFALTAMACGFLLVRSGSVAARNIELLSRTRGRELAIAAASMAGEQFTGPAMVRLSGTFNRIVATSKGRGDSFEVREIAVLDREGRVRAHNDVAYAAGKAEPIFQGAKFEAVLNLPSRDPVLFEVVETAAPALPLPGFLEPYRARLAPLIPNLAGTPSLMHIGAAVYRVDEEQASARLHMMVAIRGGALFQEGLLAIVLEALAASAVAGVLGFLVGLLLVPKPQVLVAVDQTATAGEASVDAEFPEDALSKDHVPLPEPLPSDPEPHATHDIPSLEDQAAAAHGGAHAPEHAVAEPARPAHSYQNPTQRLPARAPASVRVAYADEIPEAIPLD